MNTDYTVLLTYKELMTTTPVGVKFRETNFDPRRGIMVDGTYEAYTEYGFGYDRWVVTPTIRAEIYKKFKEDLDKQMLPYLACMNKAAIENKFAAEDYPLEVENLTDGKIRIKSATGKTLEISPTLENGEVPTYGLKIPYYTYKGTSHIGGRTDYEPDTNLESIIDLKNISSGYKHMIDTPYNICVIGHYPKFQKGTISPFDNSGKSLSMLGLEDFINPDIFDVLKKYENKTSDFELKFLISNVNSYLKEKIIENSKIGFPLSEAIRTFDALNRSENQEEFYQKYLTYDNWIERFSEIYILLRIKSMSLFLPVFLLFLSRSIETGTSADLTEEQKQKFEEAKNRDSSPLLD